MTIEPITDRPQRADARRNRERILAAAREAFAAHGADAQMDDVARRAGVGVGTVYRHFPTKEALMGELIAQRFGTFVENAREALAIADPWEAFAGLLLRNAELMARDVAVQQALMGWHASWELAEPNRCALDEIGAVLIARGIKAGVLRSDLSVQDIGMLMCGVSSTMSIERFDWRRHLEIVLDGLRA